MIKALGSIARMKLLHIQTLLDLESSENVKFLAFFSPIIISCIFSSIQAFNLNYSGFIIATTITTVILILYVVVPTTIFTGKIKLKSETSMFLKKFIIMSILFFFLYILISFFSIIPLSNNTQLDIEPFILLCLMISITISFFVNLHLLIVKKLNINGFAPLLILSLMFIIAFFIF